mmetsp:Transcript_23829/g.45362  ORF Transcript_23829/g.45362 Transcript_23829/m.45362 type:complete len:383 (+) Transcript_23829:56-1204(+)|eukprot:scaffold9362_cov197-Amphora_coffeaeformis.AAC.2
MRTTLNRHHVHIVSPCHVQQEEDIKQQQQEQQYFYDGTLLDDDDTTHIETCEVVPLDDSSVSEPDVADVLTTRVIFNEDENENEDEETLSHLPLATALDDNDLSSPHCSSPLSTHPEHHHHANVEPDAYLHHGLRPEFIYAEALLPNDHDKDETLLLQQIGMTFESRQQPQQEGEAKSCGVLVASLSADSPFQGSYIRPGDHIVAINHISCADTSVEKLEELIVRSTSAALNKHHDEHKKLSICVHNMYGAPSLVSSSIVKPSGTAKVGITLSRRYGDGIHVKALSNESLFGDGALLLPKQRCLAVNGRTCEALSAHEASAVIADTVSRVTIVTEIQRTAAVTIAQYESDHHSHLVGGFWRKVMAGILAGGGPPSASKLSSL